MAKRVKVGDIVQILTAKGVAYAQFTHKNREYGQMLSVFEGFHKNEPDDFSTVTKSKVQFHAFFPLQYALNQGLLSVVANVKVAPQNLEMPKFRTCHFSNTGEKSNWAIWDGESSIRLGRDLNDDEKKYSMRGIISAPLLVERIENEYRPETHDV